MQTICRPKAVLLLIFASAALVTSARTSFANEKELNNNNDEELLLGCWQQIYKKYKSAPFNDLVTICFKKDGILDGGAMEGGFVGSVQEVGGKWSHNKNLIKFTLYRFEMPSETMKCQYSFSNKPNTLELSQCRLSGTWNK